MITLQGERLLPKNFQPKAKPTRHSQMFWGAFNYDKPTALVALRGSETSARGGVNGARILELYQEHLETICETGSIFLQDNARPCSRD